LLLFPVFLAGSMGFAVNNTKAVLEALIGKKTGFARTPKEGIVGTAPKPKVKKYKSNKFSWIVLFEILLALYFVVGVGISVYYLEIAAIPFQLLFLLGFGTVGYLSLRHAIFSK